MKQPLPLLQPLPINDPLHRILDLALIRIRQQPARFVQNVPHMHEPKLDSTITQPGESPSERRDQRRRRRRAIIQRLLPRRHSGVFVPQRTEKGVSLARCWTRGVGEVRFAVLLVQEQAEEEFGPAGEEEFFARELDFGARGRVRGCV